MIVCWIDCMKVTSVSHKKKTARPATCKSAGELLIFKK